MLKTFPAVFQFAGTCEGPVDDKYSSVVSGQLGAVMLPLFCHMHFFLNAPASHVKVQ